MPALSAENANLVSCFQAIAAAHRFRVVNNYFIFIQKPKAFPTPTKKSTMESTIIVFSQFLPPNPIVHKHL